MTGAGIWDPGAYDNNMTLTEHMERIPSTPVDPTTQSYDCEGDWIARKAKHTNQRRRYCARTRKEKQKKCHGSKLRNRVVTWSNPVSDNGDDPTPRTTPDPGTPTKLCSALKFDPSETTGDESHCDIEGDAPSDENDHIPSSLIQVDVSDNLPGSSKGTVRCPH